MTGASTAVRVIPLLAGGIPLLVGVLCYWISVRYGLVPSCVVFWDGCVSISAAGRSPPAVFLFKGGFLPAATIIALYWWITGSWLIALGASPAAANTVRAIGIVGALFLMLYTTYLGSSGDFYRLMRRYGVTVYFAFTVLAQILAARSLLRLAIPQVVPIARTQLGLCVALLALGLAVTFGKPFLIQPKVLENSVEWTFALLMQSNFLLTYAAWRTSGVSTTLFVSGPSARQPNDTHHNP